MKFQCFSANDIPTKWVLIRLFQKKSKQVERAGGGVGWGGGGGEDMKN